MSEKFPVISIAKQAYSQALTYRKGLAYTALLTMGLFALGYGLIYAVFGSGTAEMLEVASHGGKMPMPAANGATILWALLALAIVFFFFSMIFNMWVRYGSLGEDGVAYSSTATALKAGFITMVKFFFIGILLVIVAGVVNAVLMITGVMPPAPEGEMLVPTASNVILSTLVLYGVISGIYSLFSSNLTQTALGSDKEEVGPAHVAEFAVVLFLINVVLLLPVGLLGLVLPFWLVWFVQCIAYVLLTAAIPVAHGLRYDWQRQVFAGESARDQFGITEAEALSSSDDGGEEPK
ncbi:hypothetical protein [Kordiimonas aestuarii]|uniref:hypothetical protein n=1 Tax=Kordiimonas aestuarii TaxID=1005925 RepID=UPI0021CFB89A|nr:hypothetical protein [Kordiimonas aestuarii]